VLPTEPTRRDLGRPNDLEAPVNSDPDHQEDLARIFGDRAINDENTLRTHSRDQVGDERYYASPATVVYPETTGEIVELMRWANLTGTPVTPRGAGSGLAGAAIPVPGGVVCNMSRMNRILDVDTDNLMVVVEPGVVTRTLDTVLEPHGLFFAGYPMSEEICSIGGNVAENAGGGRAVKYGVTADYVRGADVVTATGDVLHLGGKLLKNVAGYNLLQLMIGSEGTLGIFTQLTIQVIPRPRERGVLFASFVSAHAAAQAVSALKRRLSNPPSSLEYIDGPTARDTNEALPGSKRLVIPDAAAFLLVEIDSNGDRDLEADLNEAGLIIAAEGGVSLSRGVSSDEVERAWRLRKQVPWWVKQHAGPQQAAEDIVVPPASVPQLVELAEDLRSRFGVRIPLYGHAGDGNLHLRPMKPDSMDLVEWSDLVPRILTSLYQGIAKMGGTISGEHGIGRKRVKYLAAFLDPVELRILRSLKETMDPNGILNPGVVLD